MAFIIDKEVLKPGLVIFRRGDVAHDNFYCRVRMPKEDRYKTVSLGTADRQSARERAGSTRIEASERSAPAGVEP